MTNSSPVFLVGAERSGTTLLRLMLDHHPQIAFLFEFEFAVDRLGPDGEWPALDDYYDYLAVHRIFQSTGFVLDRSLDYPQLMQSFLEQKQQRDAKPLIGATVHHYFHHLPHLWPDARFIHLVRDGRDVSRSVIAMGWAGNAYHGIERWLRAENWWQMLEARIPAERLLTVHYEDLINNSEAVLTRICDFIGVPFSPAMYDYAETSSYDRPHPGSVQQWRHKLSNQEIRLLEGRAAAVLARWGYSLSDLPPLIPSRPYWAWLWLHNRWQTHRFRIRRYSLPLYLADMLSRRLGLNAWQHRVRLQLNDRDRQFLK